MILGQWRSYSPTASRVRVLPDGCRDVIFRAEQGSRPKWFLSPLFDRVEEIALGPASLSIGFRIAPGASIDENRLLPELGQLDGGDRRALELIEEFAHVGDDVTDALEALGKPAVSVTSVAKSLGLRTRTLQRKIRAETNRSPAYWIQLARVRGAARLLSDRMSLAEIASICAFADQAHMTRAFKHWFGVTPSSFRRNIEYMEMLAAGGYDGETATGEQISIKKPSGSRT